jgi:type IV secretion system protein VirB11
MIASEQRVEALLSTALGIEVEELLKDSIVSELRINADGFLWVNRLGEGKTRLDIWISPERVKQAIYTVAFSVGAVCHDETPSIAAELPVSGHRFQGVLPPLVDSPSLVIRKKAVRIFTLTDLTLQGVISEQGALDLRSALLSRENILVAGGTDSGKTTFANALLDVVRELKDRIVVLEDTQELQCVAEDVLYLRSKEGVASLRDLLRMTLRLSPDRIVIGEVRGAEALDLLKAWNTGHSGGVCTVHASSAAKALSRIEQLVEEAGVTHSKGLISDAVNILVYMERVGTKRIVKEILRVKGVGNDGYDFQSLS